MASLQEIANELNVSVSLVSKVLNNRLGTTGARPELAARINETARRLGYRKNMNAAALQSGRQQAIAILIHRHGSNGSGLDEALLAGVSEATRALQQRQIITFYDNVEHFSEVLRTIHTGMVDGYIISGVRHPSLMDEVIGIQKQRTPVVTIFNRPISDAVPNVGMSDSDVILTAMRRLLEIGRRRILHLSSVQEREAGYFAALEEAGLDHDPALIFREADTDLKFQESSGREAVRRSLDNGIEFDAVCAQSDTQAVGAMHELLRRGIRIPQDIAITGVDNSPFAAMTYVPLTSVDQRYEQRGSQAVRLLNDLVDGQSCKSLELDPILVDRASTFCNR